MASQRARLERPRSRRSSRREYRRREELGTRRAAGARAPEMPHAIPLSVAMAWGRNGPDEPRDRRDRIRTAHPGRAAESAGLGSAHPFNNVRAWRVRRDGTVVLELEE